MGFKITDISLSDFRSYESFDLHQLGDLTIFVGENAAGKTNIIEAIQLLTALTSFRNAKSSELVRKGQDLARASIDITDGNRQLNVALVIDGGKRSYQLNQKRKQAKALKGMAPAITFTPDDLNLAKGGNAHRRRELDILGSQLNSNYNQIIHDFDKVLRHKNKLLKEEATPAYIDAMNATFVKVSATLTSYRKALLNKLLPSIASMYSKISGSKEALHARYVPFWDVMEGEDDASASSQVLSDEGSVILKPESAEESEQKLWEWVNANSAEEIRRKQTLGGAHRDGIQFFIDDMSVSDYASQGQQRSAVLALKLSEADLIEDMLGTSPILLLDDVMSELDESRREALVSNLIKNRQTFITTANLDYFNDDILSQANVQSIKKQ